MIWRAFYYRYDLANVSWIDLPRNLATHVTAMLLSSRLLCV
jgi:hypothetical protein